MIKILTDLQLGNRTKSLVTGPPKFDCLSDVLGHVALIDRLVGSPIGAIA